MKIKLPFDVGYIVCGKILSRWKDKKKDEPG
jgi:hypothetical protein